MKRSFRAVASIALLSIAVSGCSNTSTADSADHTAVTDLDSVTVLDKDFDPEAHFRYASAYPISSMDPLTSASGLDQTYLAPVYDRLLQRTSEGELGPMLAESYETDGDGVTLRLRPNLHYTDGEPFTADSVKINLERYMMDSSSKITADVAHIESVSAVDELTVQIATDGTVGATLAALTERGGMMVSPAAIEAGSVETEPVGIGPYTATRVAPGQSVSMVRTSDYWEPEAQRVASMDVIGMAESQTRRNALRSGELDAAEIDVPTMEGLEGGSISFLSGATPMVYSIYLNTSEPEFDDVRVRRALGHAIDRVAIGEGLYEGACEPQVQFFPENNFAYDSELGPGLDRWEYDPEEAQRLLAEAGFTDNPNGFSAVHTDTTTSAQLGEAVQHQLSKVGVTLNPTPAPSGSLTDTFGISKSVPAAVAGHSGGPDPDAVVQRSFAPKAIYNPGPWQSDVFDRLVAEGGAAVEPEERATSYHEMTEMLIKEPSHVIPICAVSRLVAHDDTVSHIQVGDSYQSLRGIAVSK